jgi:hypothetical protein
MTNSYLDYNDTGLFVSAGVATADETSTDQSATRGLAYFLANRSSLPSSTFNDGLSIDDGGQAGYIDPDPMLTPSAWPPGQDNFFSSDDNPILEVEGYDPIGDAWSPNNFGADNTLTTGYIPCINHDARPNYQGVDESGIAFIAWLADAPVPPDEAPMAWTASTNIEVENDAPPPPTCLAATVAAFGVG